MQVFRFPSITSRAAGAVALISASIAAAGCGDDASCGPGDAPADGITLVGSGLEIRYAGFTAGPNNDCPEVGNPSPPTSLTIVGTQVGSAFPLTLCIRRPDRLGDAPAALGEITTAAAGAVVEDVGATVGGCQLAFKRDPAPTGTLTAEGVCGSGTDRAGFAVRIDGDVSVSRTCGDGIETLRLHLSGRAAVAAQP